MEDDRQIERDARKAKYADETKPMFLVSCDVMFHVRADSAEQAESLAHDLTMESEHIARARNFRAAKVMG